MQPTLHFSARVNTTHTRACECKKGLICYMNDGSLFAFCMYLIPLHLSQCVALYHVIIQPARTSDAVRPLPLHCGRFPALLRLLPLHSGRSPYNCGRSMSESDCVRSMFRSEVHFTIFTGGESDEVKMAESRCLF